MEIPVIVEFADDGGYRARCRHPVEAEAYGRTRFEATNALETELKKHISDTVELLPLEATSGPAWISSAGSVVDDETTESWLDSIAEYRRERDAADRLQPH